MTDFNDLCDHVASYTQLDWEHVEPEGYFVPLWYANINEALAEDGPQYHITKEHDDGFWLTGELPDWVNKKVRFETLEAAQAGARKHLVRYVLDQIELVIHPAS